MSQSFDIKKAPFGASLCVGLVVLECNSKSDSI